MRDTARLIVSAALLMLFACVGNDDNRLELYVDALISDEGRLADQARRVLVARGREAIVIVETGLYRADARGRRRIVRVLDAIESTDVVPVLVHVAANDVDDDVVEAARRALERRSIAPPPRALADAGATRQSGVTPEVPCNVSPLWRELDTGIAVARVRPKAPAMVPGGDPCMAVVRIDPKHVEAKILSALPDRGHSGDDWLEKKGLLAAINAGLYLPSGVPTGLTIARGHSINARENRAYSGFLAFGPRRAGLEEVALAGRDCPGFDLEALKRDYDNLIQAGRLLDCEGKAMPWADAKPHSAAIVGIDSAGKLVLIHVQALYRMADLAMELERALELRGAVFVEGGSEAQLAVESGGLRWSLRGGYGFALGLGGSRAAEKIPNIIGFAQR